MPYLHFISTKLDSKSGQIIDLHVIFERHSITKIFNIDKNLKNEKNQKLKKKNRDNREKGPIRQKKKEAQIFFQANNSQNKKK